MNDWTLRPAVDMARAHPEEFKLPPLDDTEGLVFGDFAKLCFEFTPLFPDAPGGERMWVQVMGRHGCGHYLGRLSNDPLHAPLRCGDEVDFKPEDVLAVMKKDEAVTGREDIGWTGHEKNDPDNWRKR